jgi:hypothetical protein
MLLICLSMVITLGMSDGIMRKARLAADQCTRSGPRLVFLTLSLLCLVPAIANAICLPPVPAPNTSDPYAFIHTTIGCAHTLLKPFEQSSDVVIVRSALPLGTSYAVLAQLNTKRAQEIVAALDDPATKRGALVDRLTSLQGGVNDFLQTAAAGSGVAMYALVKFTDSGGPTGRLKITRIQRRQLAAHVEAVFELSIRGGPHQDQNVLETAASGIHGFLLDPQWRAADDP